MSGIPGKKIDKIIQRLSAPGEKLLSGQIAFVEYIIMTVIFFNSTISVYKSLGLLPKQET